MSEELAILYQLQQVDTDLARLKAELAKLDNGAELKMEVAASETEYKTLLNQHHGSEAEASALELEIKTLQEKKTKFEGQLYGGTVHNPRQLSDLQEEVEMLDREVGKLEDRELEVMETVEGQRAQLALRREDLAEKKERLQSVLARYTEVHARLTDLIAAAEEQRQTVAAQANPTLLKRYEQIRTRQGNLGIVRVTGDTCPGCRVTLASELQKELRTGRVGLTCDNCGRLLYREQPA